MGVYSLAFLSYLFLFLLAVMDSFFASMGNCTVALEIQFGLLMSVLFVLSLFCDNKVGIYLYKGV